MDVLRWVVGGIGAILAGLGMLGVLAAGVARIDDSDDLAYCMWADSVIGGMLAIGLLFFAFWSLPYFRTIKIMVMVVAVVVAALLWSVVSAGLIRWHLEQVRIRSTLN